MIRKQEATGKTVDEARAKACALLGVQADDLNVSCEVLEMPQKTGFLGLKLTPAKVCVSVEEPDAPAAAPAEPVVEKKTPVQEAVKAAPVAEEPAAAAAQPEAKAEEPAAPAAEAAAEQPAAEEEEPEVPIVIEENAKIKAAVDYLREVIALMGVENVSFSAVQKGEATIIRLDGEKLGALIGRRGETMESLSYLAQTEFMKLLRHERKIELAFEGHRFWDLRRWGLASTVLNGTSMHGVKPIKVGDNEFTYEVVDIDGGKTRVWEERYARFPIPLGEIEQNEAVQQFDEWK